MSPKKNNKKMDSEYSSSFFEMNENDESEDCGNKIILNKSFSSIDNTNHNNSQHDISVDF